MSYRLTQDQADHSDLSSGRVLVGLPGTPALPVRLASEVFLRCAALLKAAGRNPPYALFDPCCGAAYHLAIIGFLHTPELREITAADIDERAVAAARRNLGLLNQEGLRQRMREIAEMTERFGKPSHMDAYRSAEALLERLKQAPAGTALKTRVFQANALDPGTIQRAFPEKDVDIVIADVPYGWHSQWSGAQGADPSNPLQGLLSALAGGIQQGSLVAVISDKSQKAAHPAYRRRDHFQIGKRRIEILSLRSG